MGRNKLSYEKRRESAANPASKKLFSIMSEKRTNLALSCDVTDSEELLRLAELLGPEIAVLKTHADIVEGFTCEIGHKLMDISKRHNFLIFEDRKFADIGHTAMMQYAQGSLKISGWANLVSMNLLPGPGQIEGIGSIIRKANDGNPRGILVLAQMSSEKNLANEEYTKKVVEFGHINSDVVSGYIGNGSNPSDLNRLSEMSLPGDVIMTPGIKMGDKGDAMGQNYNTPERAVLAGSDCIIVGRGIYEEDDPLLAAVSYRKAGWNAYLERIDSG